MKTPSVLLCCFLFVLQATAQPPNAPFLVSALNSASYDRSGIAQGSLFVVFGRNIGPAQIVQASSFPLQSQLGGTAITVSSGSTTLSCPMVYTVSGQAAAILPSNTPLGPALLMLTYNGVPSPNPVPIQVVPSAAGIYTLSSSGLGPGIFTALDNSLKTFTATAKAGDTVTAWATGLGPIQGPDNSLPQSFPNFPGVEVFVGNQAAKVVYAGRSGCCSGVDQISFTIPTGVSGCYVPVAIRTAGKLSNFVTLAANTTGAACSDTAPTMPPSILSRAIAGQQVRAAIFAVGPLAILRGAGFNERQYLAETLSGLLHVKVSQQDAEFFLRAARAGNQRAMIRGLAKYAAAWKALDATARANLKAHMSLTQEGASAAFGQYGAAGSLVAALGSMLPSQGYCTTVNLTSAPSGTTSKALDAGSTLSLSGPAGNWTLNHSSTGQYSVLFGSTPAGPNVPPGVYTLSSGGGKDIGPFSATLNIAGNIVWTNKASVTSVDRTQALTISWTGGATPGTVLIGGYSHGSQADIGFACTEDGAKGSFTVPSFILAANSAKANGTIFIGQHPLTRQVAIPGTDVAWFVDGSSDSATVVYR